jgi:hypothetical protein
MVLEAPSSKALAAARKVLVIESKAIQWSEKYYFARLDAAYRGVTSFEVDEALEWLEQEENEL